MLDSSRRVVVTGIGLVTPLGCGNLNVWERLVQGRSGVEEIEPMHPDIPIRVAAKVKDFDLANLFGKQSSRYRSLSTSYALHASDLALQDCNFNDGLDLDLERAGVALASGMGSLKDICDGNKVYEKSHRQLSPFFVSKILISSAAGEVSIRHGLKGPNHAVATACAASAHAIGDAYNFIRLGYADFMVAGGTEACMDPLAVAGFAKMRALSKSMDPRTASRPFDADRNGFVMGEGSGLLVLESLESARYRNAKIIAEIVGYGMSGDAHHITSPPDDGNGAFRAMSLALKDAKLSPSCISYINAHATSTPTGDEAEMNAIRSLFSTAAGTDDLHVSSTKGATGHLLGAAGAVEAAFTCLSLKTNVLPPTLNLVNPVGFSDMTIDNGHANEKRDKKSLRNVKPISQNAYYLDNDECLKYRHAMSNSFGFGGTNASLIFKKYGGDEFG